MKIVTMQSTVSVLNSAGTEDSWQINRNYRVVGGTITCYDADGAVLSNAVQDEVTIEWKVNNTNINIRNQQISYMALKTLLERENNVAFDLNNSETMYFKTTHATPTNGANNAVNIVTKLTLLVVERD